MNNKELIGKEVWILKENNGLVTCDTTKKYIITGIIERGHTMPDGSINNDWCDHFSIICDGQHSTVREYYITVVPDTNLPLPDMVSKYLSDNRCYVDGIDEYVDNDGTPQLAISISWGDWKHEHAYCDALMGRIGFNCDDEVVTEENGSDCYSADHYYSKTA